MATTIGSLDLNAFSDLHSDLTQYFWFESNASATYGAGAHVTLVPDTSFISNPTGQNILMNTDGFSIRNGLLPMMTLDNDSLDFNVVDTTAGTYTTTATFTATGAQIGQSGSAHSVIDANGQRFYGGSDGTTQLANIGYGEGQAQTGTAIAPYYTLGTRASNSIIGNYSMAEGVNTEASDWCSHAEGYATKAYYTYAHSEGYATKASQYAAHAEGAQTIASGRSSHAQNNATIAQRLSQTAIGEYNIADTSGGNESVRGDYVLIIGNGTAVSARSNALTVDWDGDVDLPTGKFSGVGATLTYNASNSGTNALEINNASSNALTVDWNGNAEAAGDYYSKVNQINLGTYITGGVLTNGSSDIHFSIPTGRVFPNGTTISKLTFNIVVRAGNSNASGMYIVKSASGGTDVKYYDSTASFQFYNGANQSKTLTTAMSTIVLQGGTNIDVYWLGSGNYFFSGSSTYNAYVNNQPIAIMLTGITATLNIPS